ncbi:MAG: hypothetical protein OXC72_00945 [Roseovarius sp.]|nr:hypothetical protein [Roseovarius sp.]
MRRDMKTGATRRFEWDRELPPDDENFDLKADMPGPVETGKRGKTTTFARVAGLQLERDKVRAVKRCARLTLLQSTLNLAKPRQNRTGRNRPDIARA